MHEIVKLKVNWLEIIILLQLQLVRAKFMIKLLNLLQYHKISNIQIR